MIHFFKKGLMIILMLCALSMLTSGFANAPVASTNNVGELESYESDIEVYHDLSSEGAIQVSDFVQGSEIFYVPFLLSTNSHKITVDNQGGNDITIYLFSELDAVEPIRHMTVASGKKISLSGLTSRFLYRIGIVSDVPTQLDVTISD